MIEFTPLTRTEERALIKAMGKIIEEAPPEFVPMDEDALDDEWDWSADGGLDPATDLGSTDVDIEAAVSVTKTAALAEGKVFGWAQVSKINGELIVDRQGDTITEEELEKAAYEFVTDSRIGGDEHIRKGTMHLIESIMFTDDKCKALGLADDFPRGWWTGWQVTDDVVLKGLAEGTYTGFSVHGKGKRQKIAKAAAKVTVALPEGMSYGDLRDAITDAVKKAYSVGSQYCYVRDFTNDVVVFQLETTGPSYKVVSYGASWSMTDGVVTIGQPTEVREKTVYVAKAEEELSPLDRYKRVMSARQPGKE